MSPRDRGKERGGDEPDRTSLVGTLRHIAAALEAVPAAMLPAVLKALSGPVNTLARRARDVIGDVGRQPGAEATAPDARGAERLDPSRDAARLNVLIGTAYDSGSGGKAEGVRGLHILIVDDDEDARESMSALLTAAGANVTTAASSLEALEALQHHRPDVLVSDIVMPDADGYALLRRIRAPDTGERGMVPAIAVTGYASQEDRQRALAAGYQEHLPKPFDPDSLIASIARLAGRA